MTFEKDLEKYTTNGFFSFKCFENLNEKCNAPEKNGGVYLIYKVFNNKETLIYIGSSGQKNKEGGFKVRKGGMKNRLVKGYHPNRFGELKRIQRCKAFPRQMQREGILEIKVYWWVTYDNNTSDFPTTIESSLRYKYLNNFKRLPDWHN